MARHLMRLRSACSRRDLRSALFELKEIEPDYNPSKELLARAFEADLIPPGRRGGQQTRELEPRSRSCDGIGRLTVSVGA
jgi:hypothetical protein